MVLKDAGNVGNANVVVLAFPLARQPVVREVRSIHLECLIIGIGILSTPLVQFLLGSLRLSGHAGLS
jgi:hypothetical protein